jgi:hypothetical protein
MHVGCDCVCACIHIYTCIWSLPNLVL